MVESPSETLTRILKIMRYCAKAIGGEFSDPNYKPYWLTYWMLVAEAVFYIFTIYTIYVGAIVNDDWTVILQTLAMVGTGIQCLFKQLLSMNHSTELRELQNLIERIYKDYEPLGGKYVTTLNKRIKLFRMLSNFYVYLYVVGDAILIAYPFYCRFVYGEKIMMMQFHVPFVDHSSDNGHLLLMGMHMFCILFGSFANFGYDMFLFLFIINLPLVKDVTVFKMEDFNQVVAEGNLDKEGQVILKEILVWHQQYISVLRKTERLYNFIMFIELFTSCLSVMCTIACILLGVWPVAFVYLFYTLSTLYTFCGLGNIVDTSNKEFADAVYSTCIWYELPAREQKIILLMLRKAQSEPTLSAAQVMPLSWATAMSLTKGIYSFSMMLMKFLK